MFELALVCTVALTTHPVDAVGLTLRPLWAPIIVGGALALVPSTWIRLSFPERARGAGFMSPLAALDTDDLGVELWISLELRESLDGSIK